MTGDRRRILTLLILVFFFLFYSFYLYFSLPVKHNQPDKTALSGKLAWQKYNCNACHQVYGLGGYLGPDITNVYSLRGEVYLQAFMKYGNNIMPDFHLSDQEIKSLVGFLKNIDSSGRSDPKTFTHNYDGTIKQ